jgi:hypothetical protein
VNRAPGNPSCSDCDVWTPLRIRSDCTAQGKKTAAVDTASVAAEAAAGPWQTASNRPAGLSGSSLGSTWGRVDRWFLNSPEQSLINF